LQPTFCRRAAVDFGDTRTGNLVTSMSADFRGNTDESWSRAAAYLLRNRLLAPNYGAPY